MGVQGARAALKRFAKQLLTAFLRISSLIRW
jgi:hypothetical protein